MVRRDVGGCQYAPRSSTRLGGAAQLHLFDPRAGIRGRRGISSWRGVLQCGTCRRRAGHYRSATEAFRGDQVAASSPRLWTRSGDVGSARHCPRGAGRSPVIQDHQWVLSGAAGGAGTEAGPPLPQEAGATCRRRSHLRWARRRRRQSCQGGAIPHPADGRGEDRPLPSPTPLGGPQQSVGRLTW